MSLPAHIITCHTIHEPTRSWHNISRSKQALLSVKTAPGSKGQQRLRLAQPTRRQAKMLQTAWRYSLPPGASVLPDPTVFSSPPGGAHLAARRHSVQRTPLLSPSPGGYQRTARHHTRTVLFWFMTPRYPKSTI